MTWSNDDSLAAIVQRFAKQFLIALTQCRMGTEMQVNTRLKRTRGITNTGANSIKERSNPGGKIHGYANLARCFQITGGQIRLVAEVLSHLQHPFFCNSIYSTAAVDGAIHRTY